MLEKIRTLFFYRSIAKLINWIIWYTDFRNYNFINLFRLSSLRIATSYFKNLLLTSRIIWMSSVSVMIASWWHIRYHKISSWVSLNNMTILPCILFKMRFLMINRVISRHILLLKKGFKGNLLVFQIISFPNSRTF